LDAACATLEARNTVAVMTTGGAGSFLGLRVLDFSRTMSTELRWERTHSFTHLIMSLGVNSIVPAWRWRGGYISRSDDRSLRRTIRKMADELGVANDDDKVLI
jgi:hypothetical protein